jgi:serine/threonine-protein kinase
MGLIRKIAAGRMAKRLREGAGNPGESMEDVQSRLVELGPDAIRSVLQSLRDPDARARSIEVLSQLANDRTLPVFMEALGSGEHPIADGATTVLAKTSNYDPIPLLELFANPSVSKARLETILAAQAARLTAATLLDRLVDLNRDARIVVFRLIEQIADERVLPQIQQLATHSDWWLRLHMIRLLSRFPTPAGTRDVVRMLGDENRAVRLEAVAALGRLKASEAIPGLCECLRAADIRLQTAAIDALVQIHDPGSVSALVEVLKDESEQARRGAVEVLNEVVTSEAIKDLVNALRDADWWVRVRAADALGTLGGEKVVDAVVSLLKDEDEFVRRYAVEILNTVPSERAVEPLIEALEDDDWWVHERAIDALGRSGDPRAVVPLLHLMGREARAIPLCLRALGQLRDERSVEPICRISSSENAEVRREAVQALVALSEGTLSDVSRAMVRQALEAAGVTARPRSGRPLDVRRSGAGSSAGASRPASLDSHPSPSPDPRSTPTPTSASTSSAQIPTPLGAALNYQNLPTGTRLLDRFVVLHRIGGGGFGAVYLVEDVIVREELVLKILNPQLSMDENMVRRFVQELKFTRRITHPNVIRIHDLLDLDGAHAISMEHFPSRDLGSILRERSMLPVETTLRIAVQVCEGLMAAHEQGVVHRDIKPGNILVGDNDVTKIVDFGLASAGAGDGSRLTKSGILVGTPEYISPEQITGGTVDGRTDIYSLGIVMYEMLSGQTPFGSETAVNTLFQHLEGEVTPLREMVPSLPESVDRAVMVAIARDPADRPSSVQDLVALLRAAA